MQLMAVGDGRHDLPEVLPGPALLQPPLVLHDVVIPAVGTLQSIMFSMCAVYVQHFVKKKTKYCDTGHMKGTSDTGHMTHRVWCILCENCRSKALTVWERLTNYTYVTHDRWFLSPSYIPLANNELFG